MLGIDMNESSNKYISSVIVKISPTDFPIVVIEKNILFEDEIVYDKQEFNLVAKDD